jgi:hypothetical protein
VIISDRRWISGQGKGRYLASLICLMPQVLDTSFSELLSGYVDYIDGSGPWPLGLESVIDRKF